MATTKKRRNPMAALKKAVETWVKSVLGRLDRMETNLHELSMADATVREDAQAAAASAIRRLDDHDCAIDAFAERIEQFKTDVNNVCAVTRQQIALLNDMGKTLKVLVEQRHEESQAAVASLAERVEGLNGVVAERFEAFKKQGWEFGELRGTVNAAIGALTSHVTSVHDTQRLLSERFDALDRRVQTSNELWEKRKQLDAEAKREDLGDVRDRVPTLEELDRRTKAIADDAAETENDLRQQTRQWFDALDARVKKLEEDGILIRNAAFSRVAFAPNERLLVRVPCRLTPAAMDGFNAAIKRAFPDVPVVVIDAGCSVFSTPPRNRLGRLLDWLTTKG